MCQKIKIVLKTAIDCMNVFRTTSILYVIQRISFTIIFLFSFFIIWNAYIYIYTFKVNNLHQFLFKKAAISY